MNGGLGALNINHQMRGIMSFLIFIRCCYVTAKITLYKFCNKRLGEG